MGVCARVRVLSIDRGSGLFLTPRCRRETHDGGIFFLAGAEVFNVTQTTATPVHTKKLNPAELETDLFCNGIKIDDSCTLESDARIFSRTRAGLGSGLE